MDLPSTKYLIDYLYMIRDDVPYTYSTKSKCSVLRNLFLVLCLNISYGNIVRFPRELERNGSSFLVCYFIILLLVGLPNIVLEFGIGQFLGQSAANTWRSSPIFKGASMISRFASWLSLVWISLQAILAAQFIGTLLIEYFPFSKCIHNVKIVETGGYAAEKDNGQICLRKTFLTPLWDDPNYFGLLVISLLILWIISMLCTHNSKIFRRSTYIFGIIGFALLSLLTGWEVYKSIEKNYFPDLWFFHEEQFLTNTVWFSALSQVIYSTNIGTGILPVISGKFLYKGDAVRTSILYICFNLLINAISVTLFMVQYDNSITQGTIDAIEELQPLTSIYDQILTVYNSGISHDKIMLTKLVSCLIYVLMIIAAVISITVGIYTSSRLIPRHPNYILSLTGLVVSIAVAIWPDFKLARILDSRIVVTLIITAMIFELIATIWVYGTKNIYTDLEFSIGRSIMKIWIYLWFLAPVALTGILVWWCVGDDQHEDLLYVYVPRWSPIIFTIVFVLLIAAVEIFRQVDYNFFGMICQASKPSNEWGPSDPLARHAWKQWRSVCQDTGRKDFTLRRRGTRDYTNSIKKGQYSQKKYDGPYKSTSNTGSSSPNYSTGSMYGDSAIEEDMSFSGTNQNSFNQQTGRIQTKFPLKSSKRSRKTSHEKLNNNKQWNENHREILYVNRPSGENNDFNTTKVPSHYSTRIEITADDNVRPQATVTSPKYEKQMHLQQQPQMKVDHLGWRKFSINSEEFSTEL